MFYKVSNGGTNLPTMPNSASNCITFNSSKNFAWFGIDNKPTKLFAKREANDSSMEIYMTFLKTNGSSFQVVVTMGNQKVWYNASINTTDCIAAYCVPHGSMGSGNVQFYLQ